MQIDDIDIIEPTPTLVSKKCKFISWILKIFLQISTLASGLVAWYLYDYFIAIATILLAFIVIGIVRAKLRNEVIPPTQSEYHYNDKEIADWYTSKQICDDALEVKLEKL